MSKRVAIVTGANKGLGLALVRGLCRQWSDQDIVYLTARDTDRGMDAIKNLEKEGLRPVFHQADISSKVSVDTLAKHVADSHGGVDVLIQNGAFAPRPDIPSTRQVRELVVTNNLGTNHMLRAFQGLLRPHARVVVVSSGFGTLTNLSPSLHHYFDTETATLDDLDKTLLTYASQVESGTGQAEEWPEWINIPSKIGQTASARILARALKNDPAAEPGIFVNAACPGWMITDASRPYLNSLPKDILPKDPDDAAGDVLWLATLPQGSSEPSGELVQFRTVIPWK